MYTATIELPEELKNEIEVLRKRNRFTHEFTICKVEKYNTHSGKNAYIVDILCGSGKPICGGFRKTVESQLIEAGVCRLEITETQRLAWNNLCKTLVKYGACSNELEEAFNKECRNAVLHGICDRLEKKMPSSSYLQCKKCIEVLGEDRFSKDFCFYFDRKAPDDFR